MDTLVLEPNIKKMIQGLTRTYLEGMKAEEAMLTHWYLSTREVVPTESRAWSADFVKGKGEGLIFLLHGKPGVGKTYTAGMTFDKCICINAHTEISSRMHRR
jgi:SpoVK/Ycf46/Vps4 family AAA+-type ATPase